MPQHHRLRGVRLRELPEAFSQLNDIDAWLVSLSLPFGCFCSLAGGMTKVQDLHGHGQRGLAGSIVNVPTKLSAIQRQLPRLESETDCFFVNIIRSRKCRNKVWNGNMRMELVRRALKELAQTDTYKAHGVAIGQDWPVLGSSWALFSEEEQQEMHEVTQEKRRHPRQTTSKRMLRKTMMSGLRTKNKRNNGLCL